MPLALLLAIWLAHPVATASPPPLSPDALYSRRALRRAKLLIQMRVMQLSEERLECIRAALLRRLPEALWPEVPSPDRGTPDARAAAARCEDLLKF
jgi:hypothetical protein